MYFKQIGYARMMPWIATHKILCASLIILAVCLAGCPQAIQQREADRLILTAQFHQQHFRYRQALQYYQQAWQAYEAVDAPLVQAALLYNIGNLHFNLQEYEEALKYYKRSLGFSTLITTADQVHVFNNIGVIYRYLGRYFEALDAFKSALHTIKVARNDHKPDLGKELLIVQLNKAVTLVELGDAQEALTLLQDVLVSEDIEKYPYEMALAQSIQGIVQASYANNIAEAFQVYEQALEVFQALDKPYDLVFVYHNLGLLFAGQHDYQKAIQYYNQALALSEQIGDLETTWLTYYNLGNTYNNQGNRPQAIQHYCQSIQVIESIRSKLRIDDFRLSFIEDKTKVYKALIDTLLQDEKEEEAFNYLERAKSRALVELLSTHKIRSEAGLNESLLQEQKQLDEKIRNLLERLQREYTKPQEKRTAIDPLSEDLRQARQDYQTLLHDIHIAHPEYASLISVNPLKLHDIQKLVPDRTAFLEYLILDEKIVIFVITRNTFHVMQVPIPQSELQSTVLAFRIDIEREIPAWQEKSRWLYSQLIQPVEEYLDNVDTLSIIPYGILHYLPFETLLSNQDDTEQGEAILLERFNVFYNPSSTVFKFILAKETPPNSFQTSSSDRQNTILILANPDNTLAYAEKETKEIQALYPQATVFTGSEATEYRVKELAGKYPIVHFATHGMLDPFQPLFSSLILADGVLEVHEIFNDLNLEHNTLVTLSACNTALGKRTGGDEILGLTRAFMYAGSPSILATLWAVDDQSTALLMKRFYHYWQYENKVQALRLAKISLFRDLDPEHRVFHHPYYWAAFELIGNYQ